MPLVRRRLWPASWEPFLNWAEGPVTTLNPLVLGTPALALNAPTLPLFTITPLPTFAQVGAEHDEVAHVAERRFDGDLEGLHRLVADGVGRRAGDGG
jgi:hypothetical protein